CARLQVEFDYW
nr:immunoglobulin heavy chain junction region [Macaca mulatta]